MNAVDYTLVGLYLVGMLWLGRRFKHQQARTDYFLAGRSMSWFPLGMSAMATQLSAISFISAPAFVGLRPGGGMKWLTYEFGVPLAMIAVMTVIGPLLHRSGVVSVYSFLEQRFGPSSRLLLAFLFLLSRGVGAGITIYAIGLILSSIMGFAFWKTMLVLGLVTVGYSLEGGMKAIVYSEVAQMLIKVAGIIAITLLGLKHIGGWHAFTAQVDPSRTGVIDLRNVGLHGQEYGFWPMLFGGIFLYTAYYGTDQTQAQRLLAAKDEGTVRRLLLFNGLCRFPITLAYCVGGLVLGTFARLDASYGAQVPAGKPDLLVPVFISHYLPHGLMGLIVVALIAAWMSSYSSTLNSLTAVTMEDFLGRWRPVPSAAYVAWSRSVGLVWGAITMTVAFFADRIASTAIEALNKIGSITYGPILSIFLLAGLRGVTTGAANAGVAAGVVLNLLLWLKCPGLFWFWWNAAGAVATISVALALSALRGPKAAPALQPAGPAGAFPRREILLLLGWFAAILIVCFALPHFV